MSDNHRARDFISSFASNFLDIEIPVLRGKVPATIVNAASQNKFAEQPQQNYDQIPDTHRSLPSNTHREEVQSPTIEMIRRAQVRVEQAMPKTENVIFESSTFMKSQEEVQGQNPSFERQKQEELLEQAMLKIFEQPPSWEPPESLAPKSVTQGDPEPRQSSILPSPPKSVELERERLRQGQRFHHKEQLIFRKWLVTCALIFLMYDRGKFMELYQNDVRQHLTSLAMISLTLLLIIIVLVSYLKSPVASYLGIYVVLLRMSLVRIFHMLEFSRFTDGDEVDVTQLSNLIARANLTVYLILVHLMASIRQLPRTNERRLFMGISFTLVFGFFFLQCRDMLKVIDFSSMVLHASTSFIIIPTLVVFIRIAEEGTRIYLTHIVQQKEQNDKFALMIDATGEAYLNLSHHASEKPKVSYANSLSAEIFAREAAADVLQAGFEERPLFFIVQKPGGESEEEEQFQMCQNREACDSVGALSLLEILALPEGEYLFSFNRDIASYTQMNQIQSILEKQGQRPFQFFLMKSFFLKRSLVEGECEQVVRFIDMSSKILLDNLNTERKYLGYMNSTISHEMRNPLNSITCQIQVLNSLQERLSSLSQGMENHLAQQELEECQELQRRQKESLSICNSACRLLKFNVEDILALPQLKEGRFTKNIAEVNLQQAVAEVMAIQEVQALKKSSHITFSHQGFLSLEGMRQPIDEMRFQQVLLNYQSNALKFIDKPRGRIKIFLQFILNSGTQAAKTHELAAVNAFKEEIIQFYGLDLIALTEQSESEMSIFKPSSLDKIVLTVMDNGVGIQDQDKDKLFKLFGCLKATRKMNTQGIGLGLVITKMITEEFGGQTKVYSKFKHGTVFQSSFLLSRDDTHRAKQNNEHSLAPKFLKEIQQRRKSLLLTCRQNLAQIDAGVFCKPKAKRILIVDDEYFNVEALASMVKILDPHLGPSVDTALNGQEALSKIIQAIKPSGGSRHIGEEWTLEEKIKMAGEGVAMECDYSLVFMDCSMPFMDGYECCSRALEVFAQCQIQKKPKIMAVTGHVEAQYLEKALQAGMNQVYSKPIVSDTVAQILLQAGFLFRIPDKVRREVEAMRE